jgi:hypothetical protein
MKNSGGWGGALQAGTVSAGNYIGGPIIKQKIVKVIAVL